MVKVELLNYKDDISVLIRQANTKDAKAIIALTSTVGAETNYLTFGSEGIEMTVEQEERLINTYNQSVSALLLVAEVNKKIVGLANVAPIDFNRQSHVLEIGVSIIKEYWGIGLGTSLVETLINFANDIKSEVLTLEVVKDNYRAIRLYKKLGFEICGKLSRRLKVGTVYYDTYIMELLLKK